MDDMVSGENPNWVLEYGLLDDLPTLGRDLQSLDSSGVFWSSHSYSPPTAANTSAATNSAAANAASTPVSLEFEDSFANSDGVKETSCRKRARSGSCASGSKACKEKLRRDRLNDRFLELGSILDPGRPPKVDKTAILVDAARMVTQLRDETQKLKDSNQSLQEKINELKAEKNELRDEKLRFKTEKEEVERQVKSLSSQPTFLPHPHAIPSPFAAPPQVMAGKMMPFVGYPGVSMWQFMPPTAVDTSQDPFLRPPVA